MFSIREIPKYIFKDFNEKTLTTQKIYQIFLNYRILANIIKIRILKNWWNTHLLIKENSIGDVSIKF